ncbi:MAG: BatA and WFA domain-containing protein [Chthoniobacterales bacterium]
MFAFLAPLALIGSLLLAIPILVHIFKPRKVRQTAFSSLRWLKVSQQRLSRRIQWHQILLFILRALFILFLVLAIAKPVLFFKGKNTFAERFVILDVSRSMSYTAPERETPFEQGKQIAENLLSQGLAGDSTSVMLTGKTTTTFGPPSQTSDLYLSKLSAAKPTLADTDLSSALQIIKPMLLDKPKNTSADLYFITDNHQQSWSQGGISTFLDRLKVPVRVHLIHVGVSAPQNAWIVDARLIETTNPPKRTIRVQVSCVGDEEQQRTIRITRLPGLPNLSEKVKLSPGRLSQVEIVIPTNYDMKGKVAQIELDPKDSLPSDDQFWLNLDARGLTRVLLIEPESTQVAALQPGLHLRMALEALGGAANGNLQIIQKTPDTVSAQDITPADVIFMVNVPKLSQTVLVQLQTRVRSGAGLVLFLGPAVQLPFYNTELFNPSNPSEGLSPAPLATLVNAEQKGGQLASVTRIQWNHPMLSPLFDPTYNDLSQTRISNYYTLGAMPAGSAAEILAWINDLDPLILERGYGLGKVILFNTSANDQWSDLPRRKSFVPLLDRVINRLAGGVTRRIFQVGDVIALPITLSGKDAKVTVTTPSGKTITPTLHTINTQTIMRLDAVDEIGVYVAQETGANENSAITFVVQPGLGDSVLTPIDPATLKSWWTGATFEFIHPDPTSKTAAVTTGRFLLWPWLIGLACLMLLAEMFFVHWLCPRVNPKVITSSVPSRGIMAPTSAPADT